MNKYLKYLYYLYFTFVLLELALSLFHVIRGDLVNATFSAVWVVIAIEMWRLYDDGNGKPFA